MARQSRPAVASRGAFDALAVEGGDYVSDDEAAPPPPAASSVTTTTPSKKAAARKRAALRKKLSKGELSASEGTESDSPAARAMPPVPPILSAAASTVQQETSRAASAAKSAITSATAPPTKQNGTTAAKTVKIDDTSATLARDQDADGASKSSFNAAAMESASTSDAESVVRYLDDDDDEDDSTDVEDTAADAEPQAHQNQQQGLRQQSLPSAAKRELQPIRASSPPGSKQTTPTPKSPVKEAYTGADHDPNKKIKAIITRTVWGLVMGGGAIGLVFMGHIYVIVLVFVCQAVVYSELTNLFDAGYSGATNEQGETVIQSQKDRARELRRLGRRAERERWSRRMSWYFFAVTNYFLYGESLIYYFKHIITFHANFLPHALSFAQHHRLISFGLYILGFVSFVANLTRAQLRRQFGLFGWIHMSLLLIVVSSHFIVNNILEGMIWFWVPAALVIINDIAAYVCGMLFGRHQLIKLSPKKTVEGFVGAFFVTIAFAVTWGSISMRYNYMICPVQDLSSNAFSDIQCTPNHVFVWRQFPLPSWIADPLTDLTGHRFTSIPWAPFQLHTVVLAVFASLVAPFGGFFASGFKRAFNIKDFGDSIPGHGGMTDRMDCQFLMGLFSFVYYASLIRESHVTVPSVLATVVSGLSTEQQVELVREISKVLAAKGIESVTGLRM
ncbi:phosphatidate cytidylyltransferase [Microbotryomycetes sp. JL201]|nr:phosphatidate cytidylyltransferase [Microbotryomycetes sp. JL201]